MAVSTDYLNSLIGLAKANYERAKSDIEAQRSRRVGGQWQTDAQGNVTGYTPGTTGEYDVAYQQNRQNLEGGLESRGILRSGQAANARNRMLTGYQQSVIDYLNQSNRDINKLYGDYLFNEADLRAKYGSEPEAEKPTVPRQEGGTTTPSPSGTPQTPSVPPVPASVEKPAAQRTPEEASAFMALGQQESRPTPPQTQSYNQAVGNVLFGNNIPWDQIDTSAFTTPPTAVPPQPAKPQTPAKQKANAAKLSGVRR